MAQQPFAQPGMSIAGGNRNANNVPFNEKGEREWSFGLFDCFDDPMTCELRHFSRQLSNFLNEGLFAWFLPCTIYGKNKTRMQALEAVGSYTWW